MPDEDSSKLNIAITETELRELDAAYQSFPSYAKWSTSTVDAVRWDQYANLLNEQREKTSEEHLERARRVALRAAAVDTGAIEGLYPVDRGFTLTVAMEAAAWETAVKAKGEAAHSLIESQLHAYESLVDLATKAEPISEAAIRALHSEIVGGQKTYRVLTAAGWQDQPLPKGQYKVLPNHVRRRDGEMHSYAPADITPDEMHRLVNELRSADFLAAHPVLQASYAHYAFVSIHPFADGNGRVARAVASVFLYRAHSIPLLMLVEHRPEYFNSLEAADRSNFQPFVDFTSDRALGAMQLILESIRAAMHRPIPESLDKLKYLYRTRGGFSHEEVDQAGLSLMDAVTAQIGQRLSEAQIPEVKTLVERTRIGGQAPSLPNYRSYPGGPIGFNVSLETKAPVAVHVKRTFQLHLPKGGEDDELVLSSPGSEERFSARISDVMAKSSLLEIRIRTFTDGLLSRVFEEVADIAAREFKKKT